MNKKKIDMTIKRLSEELPAAMKGDLVKAVLYGSCARGDYTSDSDMDVALLTRCRREEAEKYDDVLSDIATGIAMDSFVVVNFSCIPYDEYEMNSSWYVYFKNIKKDGVLIYGE